MFHMVIDKQNIVDLAINQNQSAWVLVYTLQCCMRIVLDVG
jgi:hypothetical protein